ncbi:MAG: c-type cytochrome [Acidimicrobiales bacterium]
MTRPRLRKMWSGPLAVLLLGVVVFSVLAVTGATAHGAVAPVSTSPADINAGRQLYIVHCQSCHGVNGAGGVVKTAPPLIDKGAAAADFYLTTGRMPLNNPYEEALRHRPYFNAKQIRELVAYVNALPAITHTAVHGPGIPNVLPECPASKQTQSNPSGCVTLSQGQQLFMLNCAQCHDASGAGGMLSQGVVVPSLHNASVIQAAEAIRVGPKPMPIFGTNQLNREQVSAIARYVQFLHAPTEYGGLPIARFGPVAEGFVGIVVGLGLLLIASRLIGNRG